MNALNQQFLESHDIHGAFPANSDANSDITGDWISMVGYERAYLLLRKPSGSGGDDLSIKLNQAQDNAAGGAKDLVFSKLWHKVGAAASTGDWTAVELTTPTDDLDLVSVNGVDLATDTSEAMILVEVLAGSLDATNGFTHVQVFIAGGDIGNALLINAEWILCNRIHQGPIPNDPTE